MHQSSRKRGYNQTMLLAEGLVKRLRSTVLDCLTRVKNTKTQVGLSKDDRRGNITDAFALKYPVNKNITKSQQVFLIDDVVTSGATLREAAKVLKKAGFEHVWGLTLAHGG